MVDIQVEGTSSGIHGINGINGIGTSYNLLECGAEGNHRAWDMSRGHLVQGTYAENAPALAANTKNSKQKSWE